MVNAISFTRHFQKGQRVKVTFWGGEVAVMTITGFGQKNGRALADLSNNGSEPQRWAYLEQLEPLLAAFQSRA